MINVNELKTLMSQIESVAKTYDDLLGNESENLIRENQIEPIEKIDKYLQEVDEKNRLLQIGIIGRVKAGKSSLINALLFDGKDVLPKAATPMTAALTEISYGEKLSGEVEFYTKEDMAKIQEDSKKYEKELKRIAENEEKELKVRKKTSKALQKLGQKELKERALKKAKREMKTRTEITAAYEQNEKIEKSGIKVENLSKSQKIKAKDLSELKSKLYQYVGADGQYMPFTKSVHIEFPSESLKDIRLVDTPGLNDPVPSREERMRELLKYCDVIFVVSPAGQFLSQMDMELMDRITLKEGISELFIVPSQIDNQLYGSEKEKANGDLHKALESISKQLSEQMVSSMRDLKRSNSEVGNVFDELIEDSENHLIYTSGISQTIMQSMDKLNTLGDGEKKVWENLSFDYPDYFSENDQELTKANLKVLGNIQHLKEKVALVRSKKEDILKNRKEAYLQAKMNTVKKYKQAMLTYAQEAQEKVRDTEQGDIELQKSNLVTVKAKASMALDEEYFDVVDQLNVDLDSDLKKIAKNAYKASKSDVEGAEGEEEYSYTTGHLWWKKTHHDTKATCRTGAVRNAIEVFKNEMESNIENKANEKNLNFRKNMYKQLVGKLRATVGDDLLDPLLIRKAIREVINSVEAPQILFSQSMPETLKAQGTLTSYRAEEFLEEGNNYLNELKKETNTIINSYRKNLIKELKKINLSEAVFSNFNKRIEDLDQQIKNKNLTIEQFNQIIKILS